MKTIVFETIAMERTVPNVVNPKESCPQPNVVYPEGIQADSPTLSRGARDYVGYMGVN